jgi:hypothetical protein
MRYILSLCDLTGVMAQPWVDAGYGAILVDPQHGEGVHVDGPWIRVGYVVNHPETYRVIREHLGHIVFVAAFPPCTDVAVSGAPHFAKKREADPHFQTKAALVAEQCRTVGNMLGVPWFFENPVSVFGSIFGPPNHTFNPADYGGYLPAGQPHPLYPTIFPPQDAYPKKTCLWTGGGFVMPEKRPVPTTNTFGNLSVCGKRARTRNIRSATPLGFAKAVFEQHGV